MKNKILILTFSLVYILSGCAGVSSSGIFGTGVSVAIRSKIFRDTDR